MKGLNRLLRLLDGLLNAVAVAAGMALLCISVYSLVDNIRLYQGASDASLLTYKPALDAPMDNSQRVNEHQAAWLYLYYTNIDYPVMQGEDNYEYLNKDPYGEFKLSGSLFLDWRSSRDFSDSYSMIYGHHMEHGAMFGSLDYFTDPHYFENHSQGRLITEDAVYDLRLFAVAYGDGDDPTLFDPHERAAGDVLAYLDQHALIHMGCDPRSRILALSTCAGDTALSRLIVFCEMISH